MPPRLYHVSEESDIAVFCPRKPERGDLRDSPPLVWAIEEDCLPNYLLPRECPRVCYHATETTTGQDRAAHLSSAANHVVAIEHRWFARLRAATLYLYEFAPADFVPQDETAGYYVSETAQKPMANREIKDIPAELFRRGVELRVLPELFTLRRKIIGSSFAWSMIRMRNAAAES
ncbi:MAG: hypothetical protein LBJ11_07340 [Oscillospiraceae bacterium]|jgi:hypothetical protein|nr:hypothetical protein [Oscillospiraceae bacterium]